MPALMGVSVVIVTFNRQKDCSQAVSSILSQKSEPHEIIVVDDASSSPFLFDHPKVRIIRNELELGLGASRNIGAKMATGNIVAFIDDDAVASSTWVDVIHEIFSRDVDVAGGPVIPLYLSSLPKWWNEDAFSGFIGITKSEIIGCNFAVRKALFERVGYFNERLGRKHGTLLSAEETEFLKRVLKAEGKIKFIDKMIVHHKVYPKRTTMPYLIKRSWYQGVSERLAFPPKIARATARQFMRIMFYLIRMVVDRKNARYHFLTIVGKMGYVFSLLKY